MADQTIPSIKNLRGNIGIGNASPSAKLHVVGGDIRTENRAFFAGRRSASEPSFSFHDDSDTGMFNIASNILAFATSGSERVRIASDGLVTFAGTGGGALTIHDDFELYSGNFRMYGSDGQTLLFNVANDDNHPADPASIDEKTGTNGIFFNGQMKLRGDSMITEESCESNGVCSLATNFKVESTTGDVAVGAEPSIVSPLYVKGRVDQSDTGSSSQPILHIDNLGGAGTNGTVGPKDFLIYQDGSIDAFGINRYFQCRA